jgi:enoyl-CoA hydratase
MDETSEVAAVLVSQTNGVARIVVSNPAKRNALTLTMKQQMLEVFLRLDGDPGTRCIVVSGAGTKSFISGADISEFEKHRYDVRSEAEYMKITMAAVMAPARASKPVIASIRGACAGGGFQFAVNCDIRIAARSAYFIMPAARLGLGYAYPLISNFVSLLGRGRVADLFMSGRRVDAEEARDIGLVSLVVPDDELEDAVASYARIVADNAPLALKVVKESIRRYTGTTSSASPPEVQQLVDACASSQDAVEGRTAFLEKRKPSFQGR